MHRTRRQYDAGPILLLGGLSDIGMQVALRLAAATAAESTAEPCPAPAADAASRGGAVPTGDADTVGDQSGRRVILAARRTAEPERARTLRAHAAALEAAGAAAVAIREFDADDLASHAGFLDSIAREFGLPGITVVAFGILGDQKRAEVDSSHTAAILHTDFVAQAGLLTALASRLRGAPAPQNTSGLQGCEQRSRGPRWPIVPRRGKPRPRHRGSIVVFSSVAGIRVRRANYVYGSAKAGLDGFATGLSDSLAGSGVHLLLARPGFVIGSMTRELMASGTEPAPFSSTPGQVADAVVQGLAARRRIVWIPGRLRAVFAVARVVPAPLWRRLPR